LTLGAAPRAQGSLVRGSLDRSCLDALGALDETAGCAALADLARANLSRIRNPSAFFMGIIRRVATEAPLLQARAACPPAHRHQCGPWDSG